MTSQVASQMSASTILFHSYFIRLWPNLFRGCEDGGRQWRPSGRASLQDLDQWLVLKKKGASKEQATRRVRSWTRHSDIKSALDQMKAGAT